MCKSILPKSSKKRICFCNKNIPNNIWKDVYKKFLWDSKIKKVISKRKTLLIIIHLCDCKGCKICNNYIYNMWRICINHFKDCHDINCKLSHCKFIRSLLNMYIKCKHDQCFICSPTRIYYNNIYERRYLIEIAKSMINLKN